jgi:hypothetical protein
MAPQPRPADGSPRSPSHEQAQMMIRPLMKDVTVASTSTTRISVIAGVTLATALGLGALLPTPATAASGDRGLTGHAFPAYDGAYRQGLATQALVAAEARVPQRAKTWLVEQQRSNGALPHTEMIPRPSVHSLIQRSLSASTQTRQPWQRWPSSPSTTSRPPERPENSCKAPKIASVGSLTTRSSADTNSSGLVLSALQPYRTGHKAKVVERKANAFLNRHSWGVKPPALTAVCCHTEPQRVWPTTARRVKARPGLWEDCHRRRRRFNAGASL